MPRKLTFFALAIFLLFLFLNPFSTPPLKAEGNQLSVDSVLVVDLSNNSPIFSRNAASRMAPASITKLMTALLVVEMGRISDSVVVGNEVKGIEGAKLGLQAGDKISIENMLYALLVHSGNEVANALAVHIAGDIPAFVDLMNERARQLGMTSTHFENANGLPEQGHLSTAEDISKLASAVLSNNLIDNIVKTKKREIIWTGRNGKERRVKLENTNKLLGVYPGVLGLKTGTTEEAGQCLVTFAQWDSGKVLVVLLNSSNRYLDTTGYLDRAYNQIQLGKAAELLTQQSWINL